MTNRYEVYFIEKMGEEEHDIFDSSYNTSSRYFETYKEAWQFASNLVECDFERNIISNIVRCSIYKDGRLIVNIFMDAKLN